MGGEAKHHHYIPQCYLRGFATKEKKAWLIETANLRTGHTFRTNVRNVAGERDFNRIDLEGVDPNVVETELAKVEGMFARAIRNVEASGLLEGEDKNTILNMVAMLFVRRPDFRENFRQSRERLLKTSLGMVLATKERWEVHRKQARLDGFVGEDDLTYEQVKAYHARDEYRINMAREEHIVLEWRGVQSVLPTLFDRRWKIYSTDEETGLFVTCDRPVTVMHKRPKEVPLHMRHGPGLAIPNTELVFPLTDRLCLYGEFESDGISQKARRELVAAVNLRMLEFSWQQAYMRKRTITYMGPDGSVYRDHRFQERLAQWWKASEPKEGEIMEWRAPGAPHLPDLD